MAAQEPLEWLSRPCAEQVWNACFWYAQPTDGCNEMEARFEPRDTDMAWRMICVLEERELTTSDICPELLNLTLEDCRDDFEYNCQVPWPPLLATLADCLLRRAATLGRQQTALLMLDHGAHLDFTECETSSGRLADNCLGTALVNACETGHTEMVRLLLQRGAQINAWTLCSQLECIDADFAICMYWTALHAACAWGNLETVQLLVDHNADTGALCRYKEFNEFDTTVSTMDGPSAFQLACARGHVSAVTYLHEKVGADIEAVGSIFGFSLCGARHHVSIGLHDDDQTFGWIEEGHVLSGQWTAGYITYPDSYAVHGLDCHDRADDFPQVPINACKLVTGSALLLACVSGCTDVIRFLLDLGANVDARAPDGTTPLSVLKALTFSEAADILLSAADGLMSERRTTPIKSRAQRAGIQLEDTPADVRAQIVEGSPGTSTRARAQLRAIQKQRVQRVSRAEQVGTAQAAVLRAKEMQRMGAKRGESSGGKRVYTCKRCGQPKKGHVCTLGR